MSESRIPKYNEPILFTMLGRFKSFSLRIRTPRKINGDIIMTNNIVEEDAIDMMACFVRFDQSTEVRVVQEATASFRQLYSSYRRIAL